MKEITTKAELVKSIAQDLLDFEKLNEQDYDNIEDLLVEVEWLITNRLQDYTIIPGWPLE